jgi:hypothetical protein
MDDIKSILAEARKALEFSSSSLDSIDGYDEEDREADGGRVCKATIRINQRAISKIDAYLAAHDEGDTA